MDLKQEIERRRTFAIISHPDAGKTTLTEKLLLYGGAIQLAGSVKGKATARHAVSDWMELEKQRGISITSSVMQFEYEGYCINILDTPGHQDFSEDTYRTLMAADSAVMVIDAAKGIEPQTRKLFKICAMRHIPIFTFINKLDREARDPFELMEQLENEFGIGTYPVNWPIGCGHDFKGVFDRDRREILAFQEFHRGQNKIRPIECELTDVERLDELIGPRQREKLTEDIELLDGAGYSFDLDEVRAGRLSPVFFGSALTNFGVEPFLENFLHMTMPPLPRTTADGVVDPFQPGFSAFVFKIQANMNKAHRDRIAFMRICSGKFVRDHEYLHVQGGKTLRLAQPQQREELADVFLPRVIVERAAVARDGRLVVIHIALLGRLEQPPRLPERKQRRAIVLAFHAQQVERVGQVGFGVGQPLSHIAADAPQLAQRQRAQQDRNEREELGGVDVALPAQIGQQLVLRAAEVVLEQKAVQQREQPVAVLFLQKAPDRLFRRAYVGIAALDEVKVVINPNAAALGHGGHRLDTRIGFFQLGKKTHVDIPVLTTDSCTSYLARRKGKICIRAPILPPCGAPRAKITFFRRGGTERY